MAGDDHTEAPALLTSPSLSSRYPDLAGDGGVAQPVAAARPRRRLARLRGLALHALLLRRLARPRPRRRGPQGDDGCRPDAPRVRRHLRRPLLPGPRHVQAIHCK